MHVTAYFTRLENMARFHLLPSVYIVESYTSKPWAFAPLERIVKEIHNFH